MSENKRSMYVFCAYGPLAKRLASRWSAAWNLTAKRADNQLSAPISVRECEFTGGHRYGMGYLLPAREPMPTRIPTTEEVMTPQPSKHWLVQNCQRCGYEKRTARGFTPRVSDQPTEPHGAD